MKNFIAAALFTISVSSCFAGSLPDKEKSLSNEEIDRLFISFEQQAREELRREAEEKKAKAEMEKELKRQQSALAKMNPHNNGNRQILSHDGTPMVVGDNRIGTPPVPDEQSAIQQQIAMGQFSFQGTICEHGRCVAVTTDGIVKKGEKLSTGEKVVRVTKNSLVTDQRTLDF